MKYIVFVVVLCALVTNLHAMKIRNKCQSQYNPSRCQMSRTQDLSGPAFINPRKSPPSGAPSGASQPTPGADPIQASAGVTSVDPSDPTAASSASLDVNAQAGASPIENGIEGVMPGLATEIALSANGLPPQMLPVGTEIPINPAGLVPGMGVPGIDMMGGMFSEDIGQQHVQEFGELLKKLEEEALERITENTATASIDEDKDEDDKKEDDKKEDDKKDDDKKEDDKKDEDK